MCADVTRPHSAASQRSVIREIELPSKVKAASSRVRTEHALVFKRENNVYVLEMHAKEPDEQGSGFAWPSK